MSHHILKIHLCSYWPVQRTLSFLNYDALYFEVKILQYVTISEKVCILKITNQYIIINVLNIEVYVTYFGNEGVLKYRNKRAQGNPTLHTLRC
jgi:hypothetical protein